MDLLKHFEEISETVEDLIRDLTGTREAGEYMGMGADGTPTQKIDRIVEDSILTYLDANPFCKTLISEEAGRRDLAGEKGTLFLDPIDGTYNAVTGIPFYALSMAYAEGGVVQEGFVRDLAHGETFYARRGGGAFHDGRPIRVSSTAYLETSAMSIYGRKFNPTRVMQLGRKVRRWRLFGASALELCYVGCGRIDGFIDLRGTLRVTDAAAGMLVCEEAGGEVSDLDGRDIRFPDEVTVGRCMIATNGVLHRKVIEYLR
ncbi:MAG: bifunctional fructose-bisphosphatase/inositol-phosphate phosphatase [Methanomicrobiales archaeon]|nr:bifunctional fructose-bisphosphatase/inositol-phosphate phosphatase [Methanomicrobiales archaeon]MDI6877340.1 bifunctional fructose-bisphosphatase/inositol-phosphate phosphatase [Methanomicrobiales archaeon]